jgi:putative membrane protein
MSNTQHRSEYPSHRRYALGLLGLFGVIWLALAWRPLYRADWALENLLVVVLLPLVVYSYRRLPLSKISYTVMFVFLCTHTVGSHYTYAEVPYDDWWRRLFGQSLSEMTGWGRNHYDRWVHFLWGLLLVYPAREVFLRVASAKGFWGYLLPLLVVMSSSLLYELLEWGAAIVFGGDLGMAYLGTQGDIWDAHKDSLAATLGALLATLVVAAVHVSVDRDFGREWVDSLTVKHREPLGEVAIDHYLHDPKSEQGER